MNARVFDRTNYVDDYEGEDKLAMLARPQGDSVTVHDAAFSLSSFQPINRLCDDLLIILFKYNVMRLLSA
jgi:hypothetical protein